MQEPVDSYRTFEVKVSLDEIIDNDFEGFLDLIAELTGNPLLMDISYRMLRVEDDMLILEVSGDDNEREVD